MVRGAGSAKQNNSCSMTTMIIGPCASQRGLIRATCVIGSKKDSLAHTRGSGCARLAELILFIDWLCV